VHAGHTRGMLRSPLGVLLAAVLTLALAPGAAAESPAPSGPASSAGKGGAAATVERLATQAAIDALRRGGNAVDGAVTAAAVLGVTEPFSCGIGGGGFMLAYDARSRRAVTIDHRETAPAGMATDAFIEGGAPLPFNDARYSGRSVGVPGTVDGWATALRRHGTISLAEALAPAGRLARAGGVVDAPEADHIRPNHDYI
jgi:gamma-glutamyltranspeptidase/glutathione hydrolase